MVKSCIFRKGCGGAMHLIISGIIQTLGTKSYYVPDGLGANLTLIFPGGLSCRGYHTKLVIG
jgi:hypothetical protein